MNSVGEDDLKALRASSWALKELQNRLPLFIQALDDVETGSAANLAVDSHLEVILDMVIQLFTCNVQWLI